jgi:nucleotidyltransferase/DNA polymerase involved in DNA repair
VAPATETKIQALGIKTGADLHTKNQIELAKRFDKSGNYFYHIARSIDPRPVPVHSLQSHSEKKPPLGKTCSIKPGWLKS